MNIDIELRHLRYFLAVAESLHFTKAAARLGIAQPALSQQIRKLEALVGHSLFQRTTRGVELTSAGALLVERARGTLERVSEDVRQVRQRGRGEEGTLTVGFSGSAMFTMLPGALKRFRERYPGVELRLREAWTALQLEALQAGSLDVAFLRDGDATPGLQLSTLLEEPFVLVLPRAHRFAQARAVRLTAMAGEPFVLFERRMGVLAFDRTVAVCQSAGFAPRIVQEAPQWSTLIRLVAAGFGVTVAPACVSSLKVQGVVYKALDTAQRTHLTVATREGATVPAAQNLIAIARQLVA